MSKWTIDFDDYSLHVDNRWTNEYLERFLENMEKLQLVDADTISGDDPHIKKNLYKNLESRGMRRVYHE